MSNRKDKNKVAEIKIEKIVLNIKGQKIELSVEELGVLKKEIETVLGYNYKDYPFISLPNSSPGILPCVFPSPVFYTCTSIVPYNTSFSPTFTV